MSEREHQGYECSCFVFKDPIDSLCRFCRMTREDWEREQEERRAEEEVADLEGDVHE